MAAIDVTGAGYRRPGGKELFRDVSFHVGDGQHVALVGANGVGKSTLLRLLAGEERGHVGGLRIDGRALFMPQMIGSVRDASTVRDLLVSLSSPDQRRAGRALAAAEQALAADDVAAGLLMAEAVTAWADAGGYDLEVVWDACTGAALRLPFAEAAARSVRTLSGGEQKRLALEVLLRGDADVLLLDEPDNFIDIAGKRWLERELNRCTKTVLFVSHDRELLARTAHKVVTIEGRGAWTHGGSFATYHQARQDRLARLDDEHRRWQDERRRLVANMKEMKRRAALSDANASRARAAETRVRHFDEAGPPPERAKDQAIRMQLGGGRTAKRALVAEGLALAGLTEPFDLEVWFGDRVAVLGPNGTGKTHFLSLIAGGDVAFEGDLKLGARVVPGHFSQTHEHPELAGMRLLDILARRDLTRGPAMARLRRYELTASAEQTFDTLSGGQQARFQILLLELAGATMLLLDEPTDNLDLESAEALEDALASFDGTVLAVTHDRWFMRGFDRFLVFQRDGQVVEAAEIPELASVTT